MEPFYHYPTTKEMKVNHWKPTVITSFESYWILCLGTNGRQAACGIYLYIFRKWDIQRHRNCPTVHHFVFIWADSTFQIIVVIAMAEDDENLDNGHEFHLWLLGVQPRMSEWTPAWLDDVPRMAQPNIFVQRRNRWERDHSINIDLV